MSALGLLAEVKQGFRGLPPTPVAAARLLLACLQLSRCLRSLDTAELHADANKLRR
jgi:hypothetical protein